jgi:hypothetical protein
LKSLPSPQPPLPTRVISGSPGILPGQARAGSPCYRVKGIGGGGVGEGVRAHRPLAPSPALLSKQPRQFLQKARLARVDFLLGLRQREPGGPVHLGKFFFLS